MTACGTPAEVPAPGGQLEVLQAPEQAPAGFLITEPVVLRVLDGEGNPLAGEEVNVTASDGGSVSPSRAVSDGEGLVQLDWRLGIHPGRQALSVATTRQPEPARVEVTATVFRVTAIDAGYTFGCGLSEGEVWCWGRGGLPFYDRQGTAPERAMPGRQLVAFAAADFAICGIDASGTTWCRRSGEPAASQLAGLPLLSDISAGDTYFCGISAADRTPWCWTSSSAMSSAPAQISPTLSLVSISAGGQINHDFACGLDEEGAAWCWGAGEAGQLGDGNGASSASPVRVAGVLRFRALSSGGVQSCGIVDADTIYCWGTAPSGTGMPPSSLAPAPSGIRGLRLSLGYTGGMTTAAGATMQWGGNIRQYFDRPQVLQQLPGLEQLALRNISADDVMCGTTGDGSAYCLADVFVNTFLHPGPAWLPVPEPGAREPLQ